MVETVLVTSILGQLVKSAGGEGIANLVSLLTDRAKAAEKKLESAVATEGDPLETYRDQIISKITTLRNRTALGVWEPELQQKIWCLLMAQTITGYEATTKRNLDLVVAETEQVEAVLNTYDQALNARRKIRLAAVLVSVSSLTAIGAFVYFAGVKGMEANLTVPILGIPTCVLLWSVVGSFAAILYRFSNAGDTELEDPLRWLFSRPLMGVIMGSITFLVIRAGFLTMSPAIHTDQPRQLVTSEVTWLIAFLAGFSDRFADTLLKSLVGRFGGEKSGDLVSTQISSRTTGANLLNTLSSFLGKHYPKLNGSANAAHGSAPPDAFLVPNVALINGEPVTNAKL